MPSFFSVEQLRQLIRQNADLNFTDAELPGPTASPQAVATEVALLAIKSKALTNGVFWTLLKRQRSKRVAEVEQLRRRIVAGY